MAAQIQQALFVHNRVWRTTDILLFYIQRGKDTVAPKQLVFWLKKAACVAEWNGLPNTDERRDMGRFECKIPRGQRT